MYKMANGRMARTEDVEFEIAEGETESNTVEIGDGKCLRMVTTVALGGTDPGGTLTVRGKQSLSEASWTTLATVSSLTDGLVDRRAILPMRFVSLLVAYTGEDGGDVGAVTPEVGSGPDFSVTGTPIVTGELIVTITTGGTPGTAEFDWDLGELGAAAVSIPTTPFQVVLADTGLTLTFDNAEFVEEDSWSVAVVASAEDTTGTVICAAEMVR